MADGVEELLERLERNEIGLVNPIPSWASGVVRLDMQNDDRTERRFITLEKGKVAGVTRKSDKEADAVICGSRSTFDRMAKGDSRFIALLYSNDLVVGGDLRLAAVATWLFPGPPSSHHPRDFARKEAAEYE